MTETPLRSQTIKKQRTFFFLSLFVVLIFIAASSSWFIYKLPFFNQVPLNQSDQTKIYFMGEEIEDYHALEKEGSLYLPLEFVKNYLDSSIEWDQNKKLVIITTDKEIYHFPLGDREGLLNLEPYSFTYPVIEYESAVYLPVYPLNEVYDFELKHIEKNDILIVHDIDQPVQEGITIKPTKLRKKPTLFSSWTNEINEKQRVEILRENDGWYWIESKDGLMGYINKNNVQLTGIKTVKIEKEIYQPWNPIGKPVILTWEYVNENIYTDTNKIGELTGLHVVSPTWFHLQKDGLVTNLADSNYVKWAHQNGYQVWGLFSNSFDLDITHQMLSDPDLRIKVIKQLLSYVDLYQLDGINLDFENVYLKDKDLLVQFVRELTPLMHEKDRTVSIDVTFISKSENWSMFYDRKKLGEIVDYVMVMAYDEHWGSSPVSGSVASLPWVEKGIERILEEVPNDKLILGVPFYTRLWIEEKDENGEVHVSSKALSMEKAEKWIEENQAEIQIDPIAMQKYVEVQKDSVTYKIWLEDGFSMQKRIEIMKKYRLAGIAAWRRGFESEDFWSLMADYISERP